MEKEPKFSLTPLSSITKWMAEFNRTRTAIWEAVICRPADKLLTFDELWRWRHAGTDQTAG